MRYETLFVVECGCGRMTVSTGVRDKPMDSGKFKCFKCGAVKAILKKTTKEIE